MRTNRFIQLCTTVACFTLAAVVFASVAPTTEKKETAAQKKAREALTAALDKYDMNLNGKMDPDEVAMQQADAKKAAAEKRKASLAKKKAEGETAKPNAESTGTTATTASKTAPPK